MIVRPFILKMIMMIMDVGEDEESGNGVDGGEGDDDG